MDKLSLENLGRGAAAQLFAREMEKTLANILDPNTPWKPKRVVKLTVEIFPDEERGTGEVEISCASKLPGARGFATRLYMAKGPDGKPIAREDDTQQGKLAFDDEVAAANAAAKPVLVGQKEGGVGA